MGLVEILVLQVGGSIAKSILRLWLRDPAWCESATSGVVDIITAKTGDVVARQRAKRQFEDIGERIALSLEPIFDSAGAAVDEGGRAAVAAALAETLNQADLSASALARQGLEPAELAKHLLRDSQEAVRYLSSGEQALYERLVFETCQYIVDVSASLPNFSERTFAEVLRREDELRSRVDRVLEEIKQIRESAKQTDPETAAVSFETEYRLSIMRRYDELQLFGVDVSPSSRRYRLSLAYVHLLVQQKSLHLDDEIDDDEWDDDRAGHGYGVAPVDRVLARARRLLILGHAGSGKTTLLQWIAVRSASQSFDGALSSWNNSIPFLIRLRDCAQGTLPSPDEFARLTAPMVAGTMPPGWVHSQLQSGRAVVLIDGVDELPSSMRTRVRSWIAELAATYRNARMIVSSRPHAVEEGWLDGEGFAQAVLEPMELPHIDAFIDQWHGAIRAELRDEEEKAEVLAQAGNLKALLRRTRALRSLATNPLLCALICALHRDRRRDLPLDRIELYRASCQMLLERRDKERQIALADYPSLSYRQKIALVQDLAYWLLSNGWAAVPWGDAEARLGRTLQTLQGAPADASGHNVLRLFIDRSGILREPVSDRVDFVHRTFQEYLSAQEAVDEGDTGVLVNNADDDQWHETIVLAAGLASTRMREDLIGGLLSRGEQHPSLRYHLHILAMACLETSVALSSDLRERVESSLARLVPPRSFGEAARLAAAGELVVPHLTYRQGLKQGVAAATVRALGLVGGEAALDALTDFAADPRPAVTEELLRAWDSFDRRQYAKEVLSRAAMPVRDLALSGLPSLDGFDYLVQLRQLDVHGCTDITDLTPLSHLCELWHLDLSGCTQLADLRPLTGLTALSDLSLRDCKEVVDLQPLARLTNLTRLDLGNCSLITDLSPLVHLTNLTRLSLDNCTGVTDFAPLTHLTRLVELSLYNCEQLESIDCLASMEHLATVNLHLCERVRDLAPLAQLRRLRAVTLSGLLSYDNLRQWLRPYITWVYT